MRLPKSWLCSASVVAVALLAAGCVTGKGNDPRVPALPEVQANPEVTANRLLTSLLIRSPLRDLGRRQRVALAAGEPGLAALWPPLQSKLAAEPHLTVVPLDAAPDWILRATLAGPPDRREVHASLIAPGAAVPAWTDRQPWRR